MEVILEISFLFLNNVNLKFSKQGKFTWRFYTVVEALSTINWIQLIDKKEFFKVALDENLDTIAIHVVTLEIEQIHLFE